jgi:hypothetical protein
VSDSVFRCDEPEASATDCPPVAKHFSAPRSFAFELASTTSSVLPRCNAFGSGAFGPIWTRSPDTRQACLALRVEFYAHARSLQPSLATLGIAPIARVWASACYVHFVCFVSATTHLRRAVTVVVTAGMGWRFRSFALTKDDPPRTYPLGLPFGLPLSIPHAHGRSQLTASMLGGGVNPHPHGGPPWAVRLGQQPEKPVS